MFNRLLAISGLVLITVVLFQNCGRSDLSSKTITSTPELAKLSNQSCDVANLQCSKRHFAPNLLSGEAIESLCFDLRGRNVCLQVKSHSYDSSLSESEVRERFEYSCSLGPMIATSAYALRSEIADAALAAVESCEAGANR